VIVHREANEMDDLIQTSNEPFVTVVTPSFNQGRFIRDTIESVLSQDYPNLEYMVIDGGSTDDTLSILQSYGHRFAWVSEPDGGQAHAINKGWRCAKGEILAWLNSDDIYQQGAIRTAVEFLMHNQQVGMVYGEAHHVDESGQSIDRYPTEPFDPDRFFERCSICQPTVFVRRAVIEDVGYLNESLNFCLDYELWVRIAKKYTPAYVPQYLAKSRLHQECKTIKYRVKVHKEALDMLHHHYGYVPPLLLGAYVREVITSHAAASTPLNKVSFLFNMVAMGTREFIRYNSRLPLSEMGRWQRGLAKGVKKVWEER
jgi:glycosyltransferase involved in cell wall biosynthesis